MIRSRIAIAAVVAVALTVTGCTRSKPEPRPDGLPLPRSSASGSPTSLYVPPPLPADCETVIALIPAKTMSHFRLVANASPDHHLLQCSGWGSSPDGEMDVYVLFQVLVMPRYGNDPQGRRLPKWQRNNAKGVTDGVCEGKVEPVAATRYTVQCVRPRSDGARIGRGAAGEDGRVAGGEFVVSGADASDLTAARRVAERVAEAVTDAALAAR